MITCDLLERRQSHFALWRPAGSENAPVLVIGTFEAGNPNRLANRKEIPLQQINADPGLWAIAAADAGLTDGIYHYWYRVENTHPDRPTGQVILCTDPFATAVDWRLLSPDLPTGFDESTDRQPASVIRFRNGRLSPADALGETTSFTNDTEQDSLPANNHMVIYELPTAWTAAQGPNIKERTAGTFQRYSGIGG